MKMTWSETQRFEGACQLLLLLLAKKFGLLPEKVRQQVETISSLDRLIELAERILSAQLVEEMGFGIYL
jgi:hypothetical protein